MKVAIKHALAKQVARHRPTLFYYVVSPKARAGFQVRRDGNVIDVIRLSANQIIRISTGNAVHVPEMVESFDYYFNSADPVSTRYREGVFSLVDFSSPRLHHVSGFDDFAVLCPSSTEPFSTTDEYLKFAGLRPGDNVIDLGAYSGLTAIAFSRLVGPNGRVVAVEPDPINFRAAEYNLATHARINKLNNITLSPVAAAGVDGVLEMSAEGTMGSALVSIIGGYRGTTVKVQARTLDSIAREAGLDHVEFVKIDIEGAEADLLRGSRDFLRRHWPRLIIEPHRVNGSLTEGPVKHVLEELGYTCHTIPQHGVTLPLVTAAPPADRARRPAREDRLAPASI